MPQQVNERSGSRLSWLKEALSEAHEKVFDKIFRNEKKEKKCKPEDEWVWVDVERRGHGQHQDIPAVPTQSEDPTSDPPAASSTDVVSPPTALPTATEDDSDESDLIEPYQPRLSIIEEVEEPAEEKAKSRAKRASGGRPARK